jgi:hypothetical protein
MSAHRKWQVSGDYFENCNCDVVCPCLISTEAPLTSRPSQGECNVAMAFHIDNGSYDGVALDGLNVALIGHAPGPMADGNMTLAAYIDELADDRQTAALGAIFGGAEGGPMAAFAPLVGKHLGVKKVPIHYAVKGTNRSAEIAGIMRMTVAPIPTMHASGEAWIAGGHPFAPDRMALAAGLTGNIVTDHGMVWDNSGKNGHYAPIAWSG